MIKVFISYAWTNDAYKHKVLELATKLRKNGIDIILDIWDLHPGEDRFLFMEKSVAEADKVLILCNKVYKDKADNSANMDYPAFEKLAIEHSVRLTQGMLKRMA